MFLLKIILLGRAYAGECFGASNSRRMYKQRVFYKALIVLREVKMAFLNQAATEVAEVHQGYVLRTNTSK